MGSNRHPTGRSASRGCILAGALMVLALPASAQDAPEPSGEYVDKLKKCQSISDGQERLACFDAAVGEIVAANDAGEVRIIDQEDIRNTRRQLFGLSVPEVGVLKRDAGEDKEASELLETTITSVRYLSAKKIRFTTEEGAIWEINRPPRRLRTVKAGHNVVFKKAALGTFFIRIDGQMGVKGKRIQ